MSTNKHFIVCWFVALVIITLCVNTTTVVAQNIYWTQRSPNLVMKSQLDGSNIETLIDFGTETGPSGIAFDHIGRKIYWTFNPDFSDPGDRIQRANIDGTTVETILETGRNTQSLSLDPMNDKMYWTEAGKIRCARLNGSNP